jgi:hypothetical protein
MWSPQPSPDYYGFRSESTESTGQFLRPSVLPMPMQKSVLCLFLYSQGIQRTVQGMYACCPWEHIYGGLWNNWETSWPTDSKASYSQQQFPVHTEASIVKAARSEQLILLQRLQLVYLSHHRAENQGRCLESESKVLVTELYPHPSGEELYPILPLPVLLEYSEYINWKTTGK